MVERVRTKVDTVRPPDSTCIGVDLHLLERLHVLKARKYPTAPDNSLSKVDLAGGAIGEVQFEDVVPYMMNRLYSCGHSNLLSHVSGGTLTGGRAECSRSQFSNSSC